MLRLSIILFLLISCKQNNKTDAEYFSKQIEKGTDSTISRQYNQKKEFLSSLTKYSGVIYKTEFIYSDSNLSSIEGHLLDRHYGHCFQFYGNGMLKLYCYYTGDERNCSYLREYDSTGHLIGLKGDPYIDHIRDDKDSIRIFFTTAFYDSVSAYYTYKNLSERQINLNPSSMQPMLLEGKIPIVDSIIKLRVFSIDKYTKEPQAHYDTIEVK